MPNRSWLFTSESVSEGHPDKVCDRISDEIVDAYLAADPQSRVACETLATTNFICVAGEVRGPSDVLKGVEKRIRDTVRDIGYAQDGFHWENNEIVVKLHEQSADIALGVDSGAGKDEGAGDQGIMFGYACTETKELMPAPIVFSHRILQFMAEARRAGREQFLGPDSKSQVTLRYENGKPVAVDSIIVSTQHVVGLDQSAVRAIVKPYIAKALPQGWTCPEDRLLVNPTGRFVIGGPDGDCGVTGRKIIVDTYGGGQRPMAAAPSRARIHRKSIVPPPTLLAGLPRTSLRPDWPTSVRSSWPTPSESPNQSRSTSRLSARQMWTSRNSRKRYAIWSP